MSPFGRYASPFNSFSGLTFGRDIPIGAPPSLHDAWRSTIPRAVAGYPPPPAWSFKPDPAIEAMRREAEEKEQRERQRREEERQRREREEKERREKEKEEKARKEAQERER